MPVCAPASLRPLIPEAPFLFSIAALSASMAGLAGLVAGLRRGSEVRPLDAFRLRQIVEFCFSNILLAISLLPLTTLMPTPAAAVRLVAAAAFVYVLVTVIVLVERTQREGIPMTRGWTIGASLLAGTSMLASFLALSNGSLPWLQVTLILLLARPMFAFLLVLSSFNRE
jgi:hypothetical protein